MISSGSAILGREIPKNFMGYFEKIDPMIPVTGITAIHKYNKKWFALETNLFHLDIDSGNAGGWFFSLQINRKSINKANRIPTDL